MTDTRTDSAAVECPQHGQSGEQRKLDVLATLEARREPIVQLGRRALLLKLLESPGATATADDVRDAVRLPAGVDPRCLVAVPGTLARAGIIRGAGFIKSSRPERHASYIAAWELADRRAAEAWLRSHFPAFSVPTTPSKQLGLFDDGRADQ